MGARDPVAVLRERARALVARQAEADTAAPSALVTFSLCGSKFAVPLERVRQAFEVEQLTEIPTGPPYLVGVTTVSGEVVSILDVAMFLGVDKRRVSDILGGVVVASKAADRTIALAAEELFGIEDVDGQAIRPVTHVAPAVSHIVSLLDGERLVLDVDALLADRRLA